MGFHERKQEMVVTTINDNAIIDSTINNTRTKHTSKSIYLSVDMSIIERLL